MDKKRQNEEWNAASEAAMKWYGWGSPVGLSIFFIGMTICALLFRFVIKGF